MEFFLSLWIILSKISSSSGVEKKYLSGCRTMLKSCWGAWSNLFKTTRLSCDTLQMCFWSKLFVALTVCGTVIWGLIHGLCCLILELIFISCLCLVLPFMPVYFCWDCMTQHSCWQQLLWGFCNIYVVKKNMNSTFQELVVVNCISSEEDVCKFFSGINTLLHMW